MNKIIKEWKFPVLALLVIVFLGFFIRIINLTLLPVFADEAIYIRWSQIMASEATLRYLPLSDGKQPLFMWVLMFIVKHVSDPLFAGRMLSVVSGLTTIVGIFFLSRLLFKSNKGALLSAFIWAVSPFAVFFDRMALVDSMLAMLGVWTVFFSTLAFKSKKLEYSMIAGFVLGFAALTKSPALFFALFLPSTWLFSAWPNKRKERIIHLIKLAALTLPIYLIAFAMYNILRLGPNFHLLAQRNYDYVYPYSHILGSPLDPFKGHIMGILSYFLQFAPWAFSLLIILGIIVNAKKFPKQILLLCVWGIVPLLIIAEYSKVVTARYILYTIPFLAVLAGSVAVSKFNLIKRATVILIGVFMIQSILFDSNLLTKVEVAPLPYGDRSGYLEEWTSGQGIKEISQYIKAVHGASPSQKIVVGTEGYFGTLPDGLQMYLEGVPNVITLGVGIGFRELPKSLAESKKAGNKTYLVINKSRLGDSPEKLGLKLIAEYPKALRRLGSREYQMYGPQEVLYFFEVMPNGRN